MSDITQPRDLPQVDVLARSADGLAPAPVVRTEARRIIDDAREHLATASTTTEALQRALAAAVLARGPLRPVVNATGVMLHTNLGRAPLAPLQESDSGLATVPIEMDLSGGRRAGRLGGLEADISELAGAESALVVNNNAGAVLLALTALARGGEVVVSRGQLVEIGGSFRVPDIVSQGGAVMREVGTTNRTHLADYRSAIGDDTQVLLEVHPSNFAQLGFVKSVPTRDLAKLADSHGLHMVHDIGSGLVDAHTPWLDGAPPDFLRDEPAARQSIEAGAHVVTFSGDKLLGGPQAGILVGEKARMERIRRHPLARALRYDKLRAAQLHAAVRAHLDRTAAESVPFWQMATAAPADLEARAAALVARLQPTAAEVVQFDDSAGAGSAANRPIDGRAVALSVHDPRAVAAALRAGPTPVLAVVRSGTVQLSMRTIDPATDELVAEAVLHAVASPVGGSPVGGRTD